MWVIYSRKCCTFNHLIAKVNCLIQFYIGFVIIIFFVFLHETERPAYKKYYAFLHHIIFQDHWCPHTSQSSYHNNDSHVKKHNSTNDSVFCFFSSSALIDMLAQSRSIKNSNVLCGLWVGTMVRKDITALKAILLLRICQCLPRCLHILQAKSKVSRDSTWEEVDMCAGSVGLIKLQILLAHDSRSSNDL